ncbi:MAG: DNA-binding response regulator [Chloroflexi bacterium]|nr:MAG: DNA-binding response regulator [Chloroflexota bacterium]MCE7859506.1 DNA-binding response regulator [Chloroflexi bacterium CFX2]
MNDTKASIKKVFLAEGEKHVLEALRLVLEQQAGYEIVGEARSAESLLAHACKLSPDVILLDWNLPGFHPQRLIPTLRECCPSTKLAAISNKPEHEKPSHEFGMDGFISMQLSPDSFLASLEAILEQLNTPKEKAANKDHSLEQGESK